MRIGIDFDGVISDSTRLKIKIAKEIYNIDLQPKDCSKNNAKKIGLSENNYEALVHRIYSTELSLDLDEVPYAKKTIENLLKNHEIYILTSRTNRETYFVIEWLKKKEIPYSELINTNEQSKLQDCGRYNLEMFIDDTYEKLVELVGSGLQLYLFSTPTNKNIGIEHQGIKRINGWEELYKLL